MPITLGTNISSFASRMQLNKVSDDLTEIYKKLSTGRKINEAGDDAAGLVISQNMQAKIDGSRQAMQNIQTAKSFLTIAEDGMVSISDHFQRINDLLTNMANDTNDIDSRLAAIREVIERLNEINRLAESTNFNGMKMLDGSQKTIYVQMGADSDAGISTIEIGSALTDCHVSAFNAEVPDLLNPNAYSLISNPNTIVVKDSYINAEKYWLTADNKVVMKDSNGKYVYATEDEEGENPPYEGLVSALTAAPGGYTVKEGETTSVYVSNGKTGDALKYYKVGTDADSTEAVTTNYADDKLSSYFAPTNEACRLYMAKIQDAISAIATQRGLLGAYENRMESSYDSLTTRIESLEDAKVPYTDTDIAEEATILTKNQILQQVNIAVMSNANSTQQLALSLLGG